MTLRWPSSVLLAVAGALMTALAGGCDVNGPPHVTPARLDRGLIVILPGIEGTSANNVAIRAGLRQADIPAATEIYDWTRFGRGAAMAFDQSAARRKAHEIATHIDTYRRAHAGRPVVVIGQSGGGAMAVFVAESISQGVRQQTSRPLDGVILLAPALSPGYDLTVAIAGCGGRMVSCYAQTDVMLRTLTTLGRNFDGVPGPTAGQSGFVLPPGSPGDRRAAFDQLRQIAWDNSMLRQGNYGGHLGWSSPAWVAHQLGPIVRSWMAP